MLSLLVQYSALPTTGTLQFAKFILLAEIDVGVALHFIYD